MNAKSNAYQALGLLNTENHWVWFSLLLLLMLIFSIKNVMGMVTDSVFSWGIICVGGVSDFSVVDDILC